MGGIIGILVLLFLLLIGRVQPSQQITSPSMPATPTPEFHILPVPDPNMETVRNEIHVETVTQVIDTNPATIDLNVIGYHDGCDYPVIVDQQHDGNTVTVSIYRDMPLNVICPAVLIHYNDTIHLDGTFEPGTYTIHVNDQVLEVTVQ